ncbi:hypothetical protein NUH88_13015 [Nisaea acidiphila]|uniref:Uncharacterized protein n=1 Tax=Nisaea acidiphila TaxID=1862145 RepID=A0A9J7AMF2_9PROT|nr:hypothetical protein [Nisaea acidiphila]UUX48334.1 hypothetical protein NUH88_13015 [Nisaea acidiphila]
MADHGELKPLFGENREAEYELDLRGLDLPHSAASVERMLERSRFRAPRSVRVLIDSPDGEGGGSHFQPLGRLLLDARREGVLSAMTTLPPEDELGFRVVTAGKPDGEEEGGSDRDMLEDSLTD